MLMEAKSQKDSSLKPNLLRRSPRLVPSSSLHSESKSKKRYSPSKHADTSWALSLHVVGFKNEEEQEEAMPLASFDPSAMTPRRSLRFTTNKCRSVSADRVLQIAAPISPRRSSRSTTNRYKSGSCWGPLPALPSSAERTSSSHSLKLNSTKRPRLKENPSELSGSGSGSNRKKVRGHGTDPDLRGSPRLNSSSDHRGKDGNSSADLLALPGTKKCNLSQKLSRRSPRLNSSLVEVKIGNSDTSMVALSGESSSCRTPPIQLREGRKKMAKSESGSGNLSNVGGKLLRSGKSVLGLAKNPKDLSGSTIPLLGSGNVVEKCLRSRKIEFELLGSNPEGEGGNVGEKCLRSRKTGLRSPDPSRKSVLGKESTFTGVNNSNVSEMCMKSTKIELELIDALVAVTPTNDHLDERDIDMGEICVLSDERMVDIGNQFMGKWESDRMSEKCESDMPSEKCLRSRKIQLKVVPGERVENRGNSTSRESSIKSKKKGGGEESENKAVSFFIGEPFPEEEAFRRWQWRYELKSSKSKQNGWILNAGEEDETILNVEFHYAQANIDGCILSIGDCALVKGEGKKNHIGRILEFFKTMDGEDYFRVQWFYRAEETVMKEAAAFHDKKRIFYSTLKNDNPLDCIISKVSITQMPIAANLKQYSTPPADFYYDMEYCVEYSTFRILQHGDTFNSHDSVPHQPDEAFDKPITATPLAVLPSCESFKSELTLLDLYSGCGGMSTGLSLGAKLSSINLVTRWAVDFEKSATDSLKLNHPDTHVRNESAEDFLELLKSWEKLCQWYVFSDSEKSPEAKLDNEVEGESPENLNLDKDKGLDEEYEVSHLVDICHGDPNERGKNGLHLKVRWKGYGPDEDTWEPIEGLSNCKERIEDFVRNGLRFKILPLPGDVDVICGGPPCQGISGYNRYRNADAPLTDEKNQQIVVFMDIVEFLKPKYVLMENVTDILRFGGASLGRYALSRLVHMKYQARLGTIAAGCYGLPQFRLRVFLWGAISSEKLPPFPLPTHEVVVKYWPPLEFERNTVAYDEGQPRKLQDAAVLSDAISDLPAVTNHENGEEMPYSVTPATQFQKYIRLTREEMIGIASQSIATKEPLLYDHRSYPLSEDNCLRVSQIPHRKGANFRDLPGVIVGNDNVVRRDPKMEPAVLPSGELLIPDCVFNYEKGKSRRPFGRLWWDETVPTVLTFPYFLSQAILHPEQDRVLTIRECARLQGFPDYYRFCGTVKERYCQVGNAVAIPVGKALGYALGMAYQKLTDDDPLMTLPPNFAFQVPSIDEIVVLGN